jgi:class 3 adenylate cyclase
MAGDRTLSSEGASSVAAQGSTPAPGVLAFLIADIRGYTTFTRERGDAAAARLASVFAELCREAVEARGGSVIELRGDEALATFGSPRQALRAAVELQAVLDDETLRDPTQPLGVGIGLDAGEAVAVEGGYRGAALNVAARLCSIAGPGEVLATDGIVRLAGATDDLRVATPEARSVKGLAEPVQASRVTAADGAGSRHAGAYLAPTELPVSLDPQTALVGRDAEARRLRWAWRTARGGTGRSVVVTGPLGMGKTRLAAEPAAIAARDGAAVVYASALSGGGLRSALKTVRSAPLALVIVDDLESASAEDVAALADSARDISSRGVLLLALAEDVTRPDIASTMAHLTGIDDVIRLNPLEEPAVATIIASYAKEGAEPAPIWAIVEASQGLPGQVHALASEWAHREVSRRLGNAVTRAASGRRDLRRLEAEVASNVVDLQLARERLELAAPSTISGADVCPFKGLAAFDIGDVDVFFGRERLVAEMVGRLAGSSFLAIVGPSGSGKSSALRAGLVTALAAGAVPGAEHWTRILLRPGVHPMRELDRTSFAALPPKVREALRSDESHDAPGAGDPIADVARALGEDGHVLLVIDQFEEIFTATTDADERDAFVESIVRNAAAGTTTVVVALRADYYGRCATYPALAQLLATGHVLVGPMTSDEYRRAIEGPARRAGLQIDGPLVDALVAEVVDEPGALPLLSTALLELWEQREGRAIRLSAYSATGGVHGAVGRLAESAYARLNPLEQQVARGLFLRLSAGEGDAVVRRRVPLAELDAAHNEALGQVIRVLTDARLLTIGEGTVEVAHEALLREWSRLRDWLADDRDSRRLRGHLISAANDWEARGRDPAELYRGARLAAAMDWTTDHTLELNETERGFLSESRQTAARAEQRQRRTNRRLRVLLGVAVVALLVAVGAGVLAGLQRGQAEQAANSADAQRLGAQALTQTDLDLSLLLARQGVTMDDSVATRANLLSDLVRSPAAIGAWRPVSGRPLSVLVSPDARHLIIRTNEGQQALVDTSTGQMVRNVGTDAVAFTPDGQILAWDLSDHSHPKISLSTVDDPTVLRTVTFPEIDTNVYVAPDASTITVVDSDRRGIQVLDATSDAEVAHLTAPPNTTVLDVWQYANGAVLGVDHDGLISDPDALNAAYGQQARLDYWPAGSTSPSAGFVSPGGDDATWAIDQGTSEIAVQEPGGTIGIYSLPDGTRRDFTLQHDGFTGMTFSPDGKTAARLGYQHRASRERPRRAQRPGLRPGPVRRRRPPHCLVGQPRRPAHRMGSHWRPQPGSSLRSRHGKHGERVSQSCFGGQPRRTLAGHDRHSRLHRHHRHRNASADAAL